MVSIKAAVMLLSICLLATNTSAAFYSCCRHYSKVKIPFSAIKGISVQTDIEMCPINAIIFHTKKGKVCSNPALPWVMDYVNRIRAKAQKIHDKTAHVK